MIYNKKFWVEDNLKYPNVDKDVINFIADFNWLNDNPLTQEILRHHFMAGYCYYFACILKEAFGRGQICWCAPFGHICWVDNNGTPYDIEGVCMSDCDYYIPVSYIKEGLVDFMRVPNRNFGASKEYIDNAINQYKLDNGIE